MACGCSSGGSNTASSVAPLEYRISQQKDNAVLCDYTLEQITSWLQKVQCVKNGALNTQIPNITRKQLNIYIGILISAQNYKDNICYFRRELEEIENFIIVLISKNLCLN